MAIPPPASGFWFQRDGMAGFGSSRNNGRSEHPFRNRAWLRLDAQNKEFRKQEDKKWNGKIINN